LLPTVDVLCDIQFSLFETETTQHWVYLFRPRLGMVDIPLKLWSHRQSRLKQDPRKLLGNYILLVTRPATI